MLSVPTGGPFLPDTPQDVRAYMSSPTKDVFEEEGVRTLSLPQRQRNVRGGMVLSWVLRKETTHAATIRKQPTRL